jgi:two-component system chemotaxis sensor kinase CheA
VRSRAVERVDRSAPPVFRKRKSFSLILAPGFSTARETVTGISGRGVGMDVVRRNVEALHGSIEIASRPGAGLTVTLRLPLTWRSSTGCWFASGTPISCCRWPTVWNASN